MLDSVTTLLTNNGHSMRDPEFATHLYELNKLASELNILIICTAHLRKPEGIRHEVSIHDVIDSITKVELLAIFGVFGYQQNSSIKITLFWNAYEKETAEKELFGI